MLIKKLTQSLLILAPIGLLPGCFDGNSDKKDDRPATKFSLAVTDAPIDEANHVIVEFSGIVLQPSDSERIELTLEEPVRVDLLSLQGQISQYLVVDKEIPPGDYEWIRLAVNAKLDGVMDSYIELKSGSQLELVIPSGEEAGLKLTRGFVLQDGGEADFTVDFDLRRSIVIPGSTSVVSALMNPTLRIVDTLFSGSIEGEVDELIISEQCANASIDDGAVYVFSQGTTPDDVAGDDQGPIASAMVDYVDGRYRYEVGFLSAGTYEVAYTCGATDDAPEIDNDLTFVMAGSNPVTVNLAENVILNFVIGEDIITPNNPDDGSETPTEPTPGTPIEKPSEPTPGTPTETPEEPTPGTPIETPVEPTPGTPTETPEEPTPDTPTETPEEPTPGTPTETPVEPTPGTPVETPVEPTPGTPVETPVEPTPGTPVETPEEPTPGTPVETPVEPTPGTPVETPVEPTPGTPTETPNEPGTGKPNDPGQPDDSDKPNKPDKEKDPKKPFAPDESDKSKDDVEIIDPVTPVPDPITIERDPITLEPDPVVLEPTPQEPAPDTGTEAPEEEDPILDIDLPEIDFGDTVLDLSELDVEVPEQEPAPEEILETPAETPNTGKPNNKENNGKRDEMTEAGKEKEKEKTKDKEEREKAKKDK